MAIEDIVNSCVSIRVQSGRFLTLGSGVVVFKDTFDKSVYIATCSHLLERQGTITVGDVNLKKYSNVSAVVSDTSNDIALLRIPFDALPTDLDPVKVLEQGADPEVGSQVYSVGWSFGFDHNSVSDGVIRSVEWNFNGLAQILVSAPLFPGNSGGPVLMDDSGELKILGLTSWGVSQDGTETINGLVPYKVIWDTLMSYLYNTSPVPTVPRKVAFESYFLGAKLFALNEGSFGFPLTITHSDLSGYFNVGMVVEDVIPGSPAALAGFQSRRAATYDVIWAVKKTAAGAWVQLNQNKSFDREVRGFYYADKGLDTLTLPG